VHIRPYLLLAILSLLPAACRKGMPGAAPVGDAASGTGATVAPAVPPLPAVEPWEWEKLNHQ